MYLTWVALAAGRDLASVWRIPPLLTAALLGCCTAASYGTAQINRKRNNPLRAAVSPQPDLASWTAP